LGRVSGTAMGFALTHGRPTAPNPRSGRGAGAADAGDAEGKPLRTGKPPPAVDKL